jgi:hypothetical protein
MTCPRTLTLITLAAAPLCAAPVQAPPDLRRLELRGDGMTEDSVALALTAAARVLGATVVDPGRVGFLSGNAFAPVVDRGEDCTSWWHVDSRWGDRGLENAASALGLRAERVALPQGPDGADAEARRQRRLACVSSFREAMAQGAVLLTLGGWEANTPHGFVPWGWAGIITEVRDDGTLLGACLNGRHDNPLRLPGTVWALRCSAAPVPVFDAYREALRLGIARIRGEPPFAAEGEACFGLPALDAMILQMRTVPGYCAGCQEHAKKGWTDALDNARWLDAAARVSEAGLRAAADSLPEASRACLRTAASRYARVGGLLQPALAGQGAEPFSSFVGDLAKQQAFAETVLRPICAELALAAADMETALLAEGNVPIVLGRAVDAFAQVALTLPDLNPVRTNLLMRLVCMRAMGDRTTDYDTLVVLSGWGNSFAYHPQKFWIMYQPPDDPETTEKRLLRGTGFGWETVPKASVEDCWKTVRETVDSGRPLQAPWLDDYVFAGYCEAARPEDRRVLALGGWREPGWMTWKEFAEWAGQQGTFGRPATTAAPRDATVDREVLQRLAAWPHGDGRASVDSMKEGVFGIPGLEAYAAAVADSAKAPESFDGGWLACHVVNRQLSGRACTATWLERRADAAPPAVSTRLRQAAADYRASDAAWKQFRSVLGGPEGTQAEAVMALWRDPSRRAEGAAALRRAADSERSAAAHLAKAVAMLGQ